MSHWNQLLVLIFGQLLGCSSLRELTDITIAHGRKFFFLGFGKTPINRQILSKANTLRDYRIFEEFAFHMASIAQSKRITKDFELHGRFYAVDSTTIDLCMSVFRWAKFRSTKSGIKFHKQIDIATEIPVFHRISKANFCDFNYMGWLTYEPNACLSLTEDTLTLPDSSILSIPEHSSSFEKSSAQTMKLKRVKTFLMEKTMSSVTKQLDFWEVM